MIKAHEIICEVLVEAGIEFVFGIPGGSAMRIFDSLSHHQDRIRTVLVRHEQAASIMTSMAVLPESREWFWGKVLS